MYLSFDHDLRNTLIRLFMERDPSILWSSFFDLSFAFGDGRIWRDIMLVSKPFFLSAQQRTDDDDDDEEDVMSSCWRFNSDQPDLATERRSQRSNATWRWSPFANIMMIWIGLWCVDWLISSWGWFGFLVSALSFVVVSTSKDQPWSIHE